MLMFTRLLEEKRGKSEYVRACVCVCVCVCVRERERERERERDGRANEPVAVNYHRRYRRVFERRSPRPYVLERHLHMAADRWIWENLSC